MDKYNTVVLKYKFKTENHDYDFTECFKPLSGKEIMESQYLKKSFGDLDFPIADIDNYDVAKYLSEYCEGNTLSSNIEPIFSNIILDTIFTLYFCFLPRDEILIDKQKRLPIFWWNPIYYLGIYSELLKSKIDEIKLDTSIILNLLSNEVISSDAKNNLINNILSKYSVSVRVNNINSIRNGLSVLLSSCSHNNSSVCKIDIDFSLLDYFIQLLEQYNCKKYIYKEPCFCLAHENSQYFFSLSGMKKEPKESFFKDIKKKIIEIVKNEFNQTISIDYCTVSNNPMSYGRRDSDSDRTFISFKSMNLPSPISYEKYDEKKYIEEKIHSFTCCERKLFAGMRLNGNISLYCKYEPCVRCIPSIEDNKPKYSSFKFYAFAKDPKTCIEMILNCQKQILSTKNYDYYRCI